MYPVETRVAGGGGGVAGTDIVYLGPHETVTPSSGGQTVRIVVPTAADPVASTGAVFDVLFAASRRLDVGAKTERVTLFVGPEPLRGGGQTIGNDMWVSKGARLRHPDSTYRHEYLHTRQSFAITPGMDWFVEASAEYATALLGLYGGDYGLDRYLTGSAAPPVPTDPVAFAPADDDVGDVDGDGLPVTVEFELGTSPYAAATDGDGLDDAREFELGTDPTKSDTDGDGAPDGAGTSPAGTSTEADGADGESDAGDGPTDIPTPGFGLCVALVAVLVVALLGRR